MRRSYLAIPFLALLIAVLAVPSFGQKFEVYPYAGGAFLSDFRAFSDQTNEFHLADPGLFGIKGGVLVSSNLQLEGNFGYMNRFRIRSAFNPKIRGFLYDVGLNYGFASGKVFPYVSVGVGAMSLNVDDPDNLEDTDAVTYAALVPPFQGPSFIPFTSRPFTIENGDTFFNFSYGGGVKGERLWGPLGLRFELRGRTTPNFYGGTLQAWEPTGGIILSWGER